MVIHYDDFTGVSVNLKRSSRISGAIFDGDKGAEAIQQILARIPVYYGNREVQFRFFGYVSHVALSPCASSS